MIYEFKLGYNAAEAKKRFVKAKLITDDSRNFNGVATTSVIMQGQVGHKLWITRPYPKPLRQI